MLTVMLTSVLDILHQEEVTAIIYSEYTSLHSIQIHVISSLIKILDYFLIFVYSTFFRTSKIQNLQSPVNFTIGCSCVTIVHRGSPIPNILIGMEMNNIQSQVVA